MTAVASLYDAERVHQLLEWPEVMAKEGHEACPDGLFVARRFVHVEAPREEQLAAAAAEWDIAPGSRIWFYRWFEDFGPMPTVVTVAGFVVLGAELTGFRRIAGRERRWVSLVLQEPRLQKPDAWFNAFEGHRLSSWSGNAWKVVGLRDRNLPRHG
jgi:hypothetical protein